MNSGRTLATAGILLALAMVLGAFGAHGLKAQLTPDQLHVYETAVMYHFFNALGLLGIGLTLRFVDRPAVRWAAVLVLVGDRAVLGQPLRTYLWRAAPHSVSSPRSAGSP